jgi:hypothetical protein
LVWDSYVCGMKDYKNYKPNPIAFTKPNSQAYVTALEAYVWYLETRMDKLEEIIKGGTGV